MLSLQHMFQDKTVSLVGNAASLFQSKYGSEIDSNEVVVRLNKAAMLYTRFNAKESHGERTDVWMFWNVVEYYKKFKDIDTNIKKVHMGHQFRGDRRLQLVDDVYPLDLYEKLKDVSGPKRNPTTGFLSIDYILNCIPKELHIYGFDWKESPTHTDMDRAKEKLCPHNFDVEKDYCINTLADRSDTFFHFYK